MGSDLSHALADLTTNKAACEARRVLNIERMQFLAKYVDDFAAIISEEDIPLLEELLTKGIGGLKINRIEEYYQDGDGNDNRAWTCIILQVASSRWQKECSVKKNLNFLSFHPASMKRMVVKEYIRHSFKVTMQAYFHLTVRRLQHTLKKSCYPKTSIQFAIKEEMKQQGSTIATSEYGETDNNCNYEEWIKEDEHIESTEPEPTIE